MEAILLRHGSLEQSISSPYKSHIGNSKKISYPFISRSSSNFLPSSEFHRSVGLLQAPPPFRSSSYPPYSFQQPPQPPLLPLPATNPRGSAAARVPPAKKKTNNGNRGRDSSLTPKKSKYLKKEERNSPKKSSDCVINISSTNPLGPDPKELPKDVQNVLPSISTGNNCANTDSLSSVKAEENNQVDMFSGSVTFTISPPPSSLPLPTFSLRPKLSCKAEASGIDTGATDNLRRLLRIP